MNKQWMRVVTKEIEELKKHNKMMNDYFFEKDVDGVSEAECLLSDQKYVKYNNKIVRIHNLWTSIYENVHIVWDEDYDTRILDFIDEIPEDKKWWIFYIGERKGGLSIYTSPIGHAQLFPIFGQEYTWRGINKYTNELLEEVEEEVEDVWIIDWHMLQEKI